MNMNEAKRLREELARERTEGRGTTGRGFSAEVRQSVVEFLARERARGTKACDLRKALGLSRPTLYAWSGARAPSSCHKFQELAVVPARGTGQTSEIQRDGGNANECRVERTHRIVVTGPGGIAVVGMTVSDVAELFRRLGC